MLMNGLPSSLPEWLSFIERTHLSSVALGLERVRTVAERLDILPPAPRNLVIAGTNGKGSTCVFAEALLEASGVRTAATLSPHLAQFNERLRIAAEALDDAAICAAMRAVERVRGEVALTYFEYASLAALVAFQAARVDVASLEVGLGGRLDAVNIVDADVAVITSIGLDHMDYLGHDREAIGAEKAGILRRGVPLVCGDARPPESIARCAAALDVPVHRIDRDFNLEQRADGWWFRNADTRTGPFREPAVAPVNVAVAIQAVALLTGRTPSAAGSDQAASGARLAGRVARFDIEARDIVLDVAHNPHGAEFLAGQLAAAPYPGPIRGIAGFLKDKDVAGIVRTLEHRIQDWTFVGTATERGQSGADSLKMSGSGPHRRATSCPPAEVIEAILAEPATERIVVLGSFDVVYQARAHLLARIA
jgi:dihydrofolate synthase/folylpolyglutamate synthase